MTLHHLASKKCEPCQKGTATLTHGEVTAMLSQLNDWQVSHDHKSIYKSYRFKSFYHTMAFVNAVAWIANQEGHHPDLKMSYNDCHITFTTHALDGLSQNDFICAAKIDTLDEH